MNTTFVDMQCNTEAIVLRVVKYKDNRFIVDVFARDGGRMSMIAVVPNKGKKKTVSRSALQPLSIVDIEYVQTRSQKLPFLRSVHISRPLINLNCDPQKLAIAVFIDEFLNPALRNIQTDIPLFDYICGSLQWLDDSVSNFVNFHLVFLMHILRFLGLLPNADDYKQGEVFDLTKGSFVSDITPGSICLSVEESVHIVTLMHTDFATMYLFGLSRFERNRLLNTILSFYKIHLPEFPELHSPTVLGELFE